MSIRSRLPGAIVLAGILAAVTTAAQTPSRAPVKPPAKAPGATSPTVATIGDLRIDAAELDRSVAEALALYRQKNGMPLESQLEPVVRRQVLENLIRQRLLALEAQRRHISVSDEEAEAELRKDPIFQQGGAFSEARYQTLKTTQPEAYAKSLTATRINLASRRASQDMERDVRLDDAAIRAEVERQMTKASIDVLALRGAEMDGMIREPRESEVLAWYRAHAGMFRLPQQAVLSIIPIDRPAISDS